MPKPNQGQGDSGKSFVFGSGKKFYKDSAQFEALGRLDELNCFIGFARSICQHRARTPKEAKIQKELLLIDSTLQTIQNDLFLAQANLSVEPGYKTDYIPKFKKEKVEFLERQIVKLEKNLPELKNFILPGGSSLSAVLHICRAKSRTAERAIVVLHKQHIINMDVQAYVNRLSDVFFVLARYICRKEGVGDVVWES
jgi:cob(I)alamin adenosyltransferase